VFRSAPVFGLYITETDITVGSARKSKSIFTVFARGKRSLPEGLVKNGIIQNPKECGEILKQLMLSLRLSTIIKNINICLSPDHVYTALITLPKARKKEMESLLREEISKTIPEDYDTLSIITRPLESKKGKQAFAVIAAKRELIDGIQNTCKAAGIAPKYIAGTTTVYKEAFQDDDSLLLVSSVPVPTVTLFQQDCPVDEAVLSQESKQDQVINDAADIIKSAKEINLPIKSAKVVGTPALISRVKNLLTKEGLSIPSALIAKDLCKKKEDYEFLPAMAASLIGKDFELSFSVSTPAKPQVSKIQKPAQEKPVEEQTKPPPPRATGNKRLIFMCLLLVVVAFASGAFVYFARFASKPTEEQKPQDVPEVIETPEPVSEEKKDEPESAPEVLTGATVEQGTGATVSTGTGHSVTETGSSVKTGTGAL